MTLSPDSRRGFFYSRIFRIFVTMKKYAFVLAVVAMLGTTACGNESTTSNETTDSTAVNVDSTAVTATDSTTAQIADSTVNQ